MRAIKRGAWSKGFEPILLKQVILECGIPQAELGRATGLSRVAINLAVNRGHLPTTVKEFKPAIERLIEENPKAMLWLAARGLRPGDVWERLGRDMRRAQPAGKGMRAHASRMGIIKSGDPELITLDWEVEMLNPEAMQHFKIFRNPFIDDIQKEHDIFMSDEHRYIEAAMLDCARHGGFLAVIGEVGSGKSVMRRKVVEQLRRDGDTLVIYPQIIDRTRLTAASICDAIIMDVSDQKAKIRLEQKTRQVQGLLLDRSKSGYRACLIIEEAHDLSVNTLKYLKRFYELEDGYKKLLGIILIGQVELKQRFTESTHYDMREVIKRVQVAEIKGLNGNTRDYLRVKLARVGADVDKIFDRAAFDALSKRLTSTDRQGKVISHAYPLHVNSYAVKAMNLAFEMGESKVTEEVVLAI